MKKTYYQPHVGITHLMPESHILIGSPGVLQNSGKGTDQIGTGDPIIVGG